MDGNDASSSSPELPPEVQAWLAEHPEADAGALREVWRLSQDAAPDVEPDPERVEAIRETLQDALSVDRLDEGGKSLSTRRSASEERSPQGEPPAEQSPSERVRPRWTGARAVGATLAAAVVAVVVYVMVVPVRLTAPPGDVRAVTLPDGSRVELNSGTTLRYPRWWRAGSLRRWVGRSVHLDGEAFFAVSSTDVPFQVETQNATARVLGTRFNVRTRRVDGYAETRVVVAEGRVALSAAGSTTRLDSAQAATVRRQAPPSSKSSVRPDRALMWRRGGFAFKEASIQRVAAEVERRFDVPITVQDVEGRPVTLRVSDPHGPSTLLRDVCSVVGCRVDSTRGGIVVHSR